VPVPPEGAAAAAGRLAGMVTPTRTPATGGGRRIRRNAQQDAWSPRAAALLTGSPSPAQKENRAPLATLDANRPSLGRTAAAEAATPPQGMRRACSSHALSPMVSPTPSSEGGSDGDGGGVGPAAPGSAPDSGAALRSRLLTGLGKVMMGSYEGVTACPASPGNWGVWHARIATDHARAAGVSVHGGLELALELQYELEGAGADELPRVRIVRPACYHPNVGPDGAVCPAALADRCSPVELVGELLATVRELLARPVFSTPPLNEDAAARW
jgi:ubiquitin-protein ligase